MASQNGVQEELPVLLAEGEFYPGTKLSVEETAAPEGISVPGYTVKKAYRYEIASPEEGQWSLSGLRVLTAGMSSGRTLEAAMPDGEKGAFCVDSYQDGSYLVFAASGPQGMFLVVEKNVNWYPAAAALAVLAAVFVIRGRKKGKAVKQAGESDEKDGEEK